MDLEKDRVSRSLGRVAIDSHNFAALEGLFNEHPRTRFAPYNQPVSLRGRPDLTIHRSEHSLGDVQLIRAYGQDTCFKKQKEIRRCNVELVVVPPGRNMADNAIKKDAERFLLREIACLLNSGRDCTGTNYEYPLVVILSQDRDFFPFILTLVRTGVRVVALFSLTTKQNQDQSEKWRSALLQSNVSVQTSEKRLLTCNIQQFHKLYHAVFGNQFSRKPTCELLDLSNQG
ncbi:unnamed protein product [Closterium sp. Yama58-4]|nr:unnamed protein product [Closterium sp. Yama58-4]